MSSSAGKVCVRALAFCLLFAASPALAFPLIAVLPNGTVTIYDTPCPHPWLGKWKAASMIYKGKPYEACWGGGDSDAIVVLDSAGDLSMIPMRAFRKATKS